MKKIASLGTICKRVKDIKRDGSGLPLPRWKRENFWEGLQEEKEGNMKEESEGRIEEAMAETEWSDECRKDKNNIRLMKEFIIRRKKTHHTWYSREK